MGLPSKYLLDSIVLAAKTNPAAESPAALASNRERYLLPLQVGITPRHIRLFVIAIEVRVVRHLHSEEVG
ncbi:hypothetical protein D3C74_486220 [compost metagenome]